MTLTINHALFRIEAGLRQHGKTLADVMEWNFDLAEDGTSVVILAGIEGRTLVAGFDWPRGSIFSGPGCCAEFLMSETRH